MINDIFGVLYLKDNMSEESRKLETVTGQLIDINNPDPATICIEDIAWGLSRMSRFCGHTITAIPPTVAQHCVFVSDTLMKKHNNRELALVGLLHDASESYIGDIPSPVKHLPDVHEVINKIEKNLLNIIYTNFLGRIPTDEEYNLCHHADKTAQFIEAHHFMNSRGRHWPNRKQYDFTIKELHDYPEILTPINAYDSFMAKFHLLSKTDC